MKIATILGARPQFIKASVVSRALAKYNDSPNTSITEVLVHTGQHYSPEMSDVFFQTLNLPRPKYHLNIGSGNHGQQTGRMLEAIEQTLIVERPEIVLVYGDTNSTLAGALAAAKLHIPIAHVEAGLRSHNRLMPEEINRVLADRLSTLLFAPTDTAVANLRSEGITAGVFQIGDVMLDAARYFSNKIKPTYRSPVCDHYLLATIHRAENTDSESQLRNVLNVLDTVADDVGLPIIFPIHPRTKERIQRWNIPLPDTINLMKPVDYFEMLALIHGCTLVLTDSGGVQKEAFFLEKPCITLRTETEWLETVRLGWNIVVGCDGILACRAAHQFLTNPPRPAASNPFGDGHAAERVAEIIVRTLYS